MKKNTALNTASALALVLAISACGSSTSSTQQDDTAGNTAPTADAGADQSVTEGGSVQLSGLASDADGDTITITWTQSSGTAVTLSDTAVESPTFTAPDVTADEDLVFEITADDGTDTASDTVTITVQDQGTTVTPSGDWILGAGATSTYIMDGGAFVEVNVLDVTTTGDTRSVTTNSVPGYRVEVTQAILDRYNGYANSAFTTMGVLSLGDIIEFGEDIGLSRDCTSGGDGWWPGGGGAGGGGCINSAQGEVFDFPLTPTAATDDCETAAGPVGLWLNGVAMYNWTDTFTYNNEGVWEQYAVPFRSDGMDICLGHSSGGVGQYHHHSYNDCLRQEMSDDGTGHSPIYGYAGDGYPVHGPYQADGVLAQSCWQARDYSASSATGCGVDGQRSCQFIDPTDISLGTQTVSNGPTTNEELPTNTGETLTAVSGFYLEDFYYEASCTAQGDEYLDVHNGHDHDALGYHYHTSVDANMFPTFPLAPGVNYRGEASGSFACGIAAGAGP